ncbi:MAG: response regulator transcription factor [Proteobacteria bacterium]|nr:response regulator transcription factor [Pseudomonadota bacterium]
MIKVLIVEDQRMLRTALSALLSLEDDIDVVGSAGDGLEGMELTRQLKPDVVIADIEMPKKTGLELANWIKDQKLATRVIIVTTFARSGYLRRALDAGVSGYLLKDSPGDVLPDAIRTVYNGGRTIDPELATQAWSEADPLTDRERQVLRLSAAGLTSSQIASKLNLNDGTVRNYISETISKLSANNRIDAARIARDKGWL